MDTPDSTPAAPGSPVDADAEGFDPYPDPHTFPELQPLLARLAPGGLGCHRGWWPILVDLDAQLAAIDPDYELLQVKEKFGGLRYYTGRGFAEPGDWERAKAARIAAEQLAAETCEECGGRGELRDAQHWLLTLCDACNARRMDAAYASRAARPYELPPLRATPYTRGWGTLLYTLRHRMGRTDPPTWVTQLWAQDGELEVRWWPPSEAAEDAAAAAAAEARVTCARCGEPGLQVVGGTRLCEPCAEFHEATAARRSGDTAGRVPAYSADAPLLLDDTGGHGLVPLTISPATRVQAVAVEGGIQWVDVGYDEDTEPPPGALGAPVRAVILRRVED